MRPPRLLAARALAPLAAALALAACDRPARVELDPPGLRLHARGQAATLRATVRTSGGKALPAASCEWSTSAERVAAVAGRGREAAVTAAGPGRATVRCRAGAAEADATVEVRIASRVDVEPSRLELRLLDDPSPAALRIQVLDTEGQPLRDRPVATRCDDEAVCRGDDRGQVWPVGPGETRAVVQVDGASTSLLVKVADARTAEGRPRRVRENPMRDVEKAFAPRR